MILTNESYSNVKKKINNSFFVAFSTKIKFFSFFHQFVRIFFSFFRRIRSRFCECESRLICQNLNNQIECDFVCYNENKRSKCHCYVDEKQRR